MLYTDTPTAHRVTRDGSKRVVYARTDWDGNHVRFVTHRSARECETVRRREYHGTKVGIVRWTEVQPHELTH